MTRSAGALLLPGKPYCLRHQKRSVDCEKMGQVWVASALYDDTLGFLRLSAASEAEEVSASGDFASASRRFRADIPSPKQLPAASAILTNAMADSGYPN
jgi:hypothetical protein